MESDNFLDTLQVGNVILFKNLFNTSIAIFSKGKKISNSIPNYLSFSNILPSPL